MTRSAVRSRLAPPAFARFASYGSASPEGLWQRSKRRLPRRSPKGEAGLHPPPYFPVNLGGLDISPIILILIIMFIQKVIVYYIYPVVF